MVEIDAVGDNVYFTVFLVGYGLRVDFRDNGKSVENGEGFVLGGTEHLEFEMEEVVPQAFGLFHTPLGIHGEGILEVHYLGVRESSHEGHGANHLGVDDIGSHLAGKTATGPLGAFGVPIAHLEGFGGKPVAQDIEATNEAVEGHDTYPTAEGLEGFDLFGEHLLMANAKEVYLMPLRQLDNLMIGAELVTLLQRPRKSRQNNKDFHI